MTEKLPPRVLVRAWLDVINKTDLSDKIKSIRLKAIVYYFGSEELAEMYIEQIKQ